MPTLNFCDNSVLKNRSDSVILNSDHIIFPLSAQNHTIRLENSPLLIFKLALVIIQKQGKVIAFIFIRTILKKSTKNILTVWEFLMLMHSSKVQLTITPQFLNPGFYLISFPNPPILLFHDLTFDKFPHSFTPSKSVSFSTINILHEIFVV